MENKIGAHYNIQDILNDRVKTDYVQFCTGSPLTTKRHISTEVMRQLNMKLRKTTDIKKNVIHAAYTINLCNSEYNEWTIKYLVHEVILANGLNVNYIIIHGGSIINGDSESEYQNSIDNFVYVINQVVRQTENYNNIRLCLETMPGKKNQFLSNLKQFKDLFDKLHPLLGDGENGFSNRIGVCFDTCHFYDSVNGENFNDITTELYRNWFESFIKVVHLNNSSLFNGKYKDRHKNLVEGVIDSDVLKHIHRYYSSRNIPVILETPQEGYDGDIRYLKDEEEVV